MSVVAEQTDVIDTTGGDVVGKQTGIESGLAQYAGDYVTDMLGKGQALAGEGYNAYMGHSQQGSLIYKLKRLRV